MGRSSGREMRLLLVRLTALGDIVHALPVAAALGEGLPGVELDWLVDVRFASLVERVSAVRRVWVWPRSTTEAVRTGLPLVRRLRRERYDVAVDLQGLLKSALAARLSGARRVLGFATSDLREPAARWLYTEQADETSATHVIDRNLALARHLGGEAPPGNDLIDPRPSTGVDPLRADAPGDGLPFVVLNPGAAWASKCWSPPAYGALARRLRDDLGLGSVVAWGPGEETLAEAVVSHSEGAARLGPAATLPELAALMQAAAVVVAGDTGPLHLAAAVGTPVVGVYGPSDPARNGPWRDGDLVVSRYGDCRCAAERRRQGRRGVVVRRCSAAEPCLARIPADEVFEAVRRRLATVSTAA